MLGIKRPRRYPMTEGIEPVAGPHGLRMVSSDQLPGGEAPPISFVDDYHENENGNGNRIDASLNGGPVAPAPAGPVELSYREALGRILAQSQFGTVDWLIIDLATGLDRLASIASMAALDGVLLLSHPSADDANASTATDAARRGRYGPTAICMRSRARLRCQSSPALRLNRAWQTAALAACCSFASTG
jgi:hypothetical protein